MYLHVYALPLRSWDVQVAYLIKSEGAVHQLPLHLLATTDLTIFCIFAH